jgi:integrase
VGSISLFRIHVCNSATSPARLVQARLGHKSATETPDTYGHLWPDFDEQTRTASTNRLSGCGGRIVS